VKKYLVSVLLVLWLLHLQALPISFIDNLSRPSTAANINCRPTSFRNVVKLVRWLLHLQALPVSFVGNLSRLRTTVSILGDEVSLLCSKSKSEEGTANDEDGEE